MTFPLCYVRGLEKIRIPLKSTGKKQRITLPTPMKLGRAMCTDCAQAARHWLTLATVRVPTGTEQIRVESGERGLRVEHGTEGKPEGALCLAWLQDLYVCGMSIRIRRIVVVRIAEKAVCLQIRDIASAGISTQAAWRVDIWGVRWSWPVGIARPSDLPSSFVAGRVTGSRGEL